MELTIEKAFVGIVECLLEIEFGVVELEKLGKKADVVELGQFERMVDFEPLLISIIVAHLVAQNLIDLESVECRTNAN